MKGLSQSGGDAKPTLLSASVISFGDKFASKSSIIVLLLHSKPSNNLKSEKTFFAIVVLPEPEEPTIKPTFQSNSSIGISTSNSFSTMLAS